MRKPRGKSLACLGSLFFNFCLCVRGNEVYLSRITIYKTHDRFFPPTVYFKCPDDDREKRYFSDVKATNHTYIVHPETVALTHVSPEYCQAECGIYDQDVLDDDDLFGEQFKLCDTDFDETNHLYTVTIPGEVTLELFCPQCNPYVPPPSSGGQGEAGDGSSSSKSNTTAQLEELIPEGENVKQVLITILLLAIFVGFLLGFVVHRCYRAFSDVAADDARTRFQALYADPTTEIEDLPTNFPAGNRNTGLYRFARSMRGILGRGGSQGQQQPAIRTGDPVPFHQLKIQETDIHDES